MCTRIIKRYNQLEINVIRYHKRIGTKRETFLVTTLLPPLGEEKMNGDGLNDNRFVENVSGKTILVLGNVKRK